MTHLFIVNMIDFNINAEYFPAVEQNTKANNAFSPIKYCFEND